MSGWSGRRSLFVASFRCQEAPHNSSRAATLLRSRMSPSRQRSEAITSAIIETDCHLRITSESSVSYLAEEIPFVLTEPVDLILGADHYLSESVEEQARVS